MENNNPVISQLQQFGKDILPILQRHKNSLVHEFYPSCEVDNDSLTNRLADSTLDLLNSLVFYKLCECTTSGEERNPDHFLSQMGKLLLEAYAIGETLFYGIAGVNGVTSLLIGHAPGNNDETLKLIMEGALPEVKIERYSGGFESESETESHNPRRYLGCISGIPGSKISRKFPSQLFPSIMRSLHGQEYTLMVISRPVSASRIDALKKIAVNTLDVCSALSRKSVSWQSGFGQSSYNVPSSNIQPSSTSELQSIPAAELADMSRTMVERLNTGKNIGMWETVVSFSSNEKNIADFIKCSLYSSMASDSICGLPPHLIEYEDLVELQKVMQVGGKGTKLEETEKPERKPEYLIIPKGFMYGEPGIPLYSLVTTSELCRLCTIPHANTAGFTVHCCRSFFQDISMSKDDVPIGDVIDRSIELGNMHFGLSKDDINRHVFVCGMTGYGKTNTVKKILESFDKVPYLVIEPAKKEYRNMKGSPDVYTPGRPELNCIRLNPFYIMRGVSPQQHIDLLKDLFSASFGFYGPLPYIFEKCLNQVYLKKGWNLTLGFHPFLVSSDGCSSDELFSDESLRKHYSIQSHKYLFPTMEDLKSELASYIEKLDYEKDVKGNIKSAVQSRIDSLCIGAKGYMFNTSETVDFVHLLKNKTVIELEGLADDSDKAFALGLLMVFINEYRQVEKELSDQDRLRHILVVEEAHRLLKNVSQEQSADFGNPKGKAVEHFANMLAEMRSYGQGVIVAEQIPSKLAPDVIKNSSVKIVHRIAAADDQAIVGNTIGLPLADAIALGANTIGIALCHKDGMFEPVKARILKADTYKNVTDEKLYTPNLKKKLEELSRSDIKGALPEEIRNCAVRILSSLMYHYWEQEIPSGIFEAADEIRSLLKQKRVSIVPNVDLKLCIKQCFYDAALSLLTSGVLSSDRLPDNELSLAIHAVIVESGSPGKENLRIVYQKLEKFYHRSPEAQTIETVAHLIARYNFKKYDLSARVQCYLLRKNDQFVADVMKFLEGEWNA